MQKSVHFVGLIPLAYTFLGLVALATGLKDKACAGFLPMDHCPESLPLGLRCLQPGSNAKFLVDHAHRGDPFGCQGKMPAATRRRAPLFALRGGSDQKPVNFTKVRKKLFEFRPASSDHLSYPTLGSNATMVRDDEPGFPGEKGTWKKEPNQHANKGVGAGPSDTPELPYKFVPPERALHSTQYDTFKRPGIINKQMWAACETGDDEELEAILKHLKADVNAVDENIYNYTVSEKNTRKHHQIH
jgi:hypothetical protein